MLNDSLVQINDASEYYNFCYNMVQSLKSYLPQVMVGINQLKITMLKYLRKFSGKIVKNKY